MEECIVPLRGAIRHSVRLIELAKSPPGIETDEQVAEVIPHILEAIRGASEDIFVIACFSDPGIEELRKVTPKLIIGIAEAAYLAALGLGWRFGIVSLGRSSIGRHLHYLKRLGFEGRLAGDRSIDTAVLDLMGDDVADSVLRIARTLRDDDGADVVILGCAGLGRYRLAIQQALGVPVIDPVQAGVALASTQLDLAYTTTRVIKTG